MTGEDATSARAVQRRELRPEHPGMPRSAGPVAPRRPWLHAGWSRRVRCRADPVFAAGPGSRV